MKKLLRRKQRNLLYTIIALIMLGVFLWFYSDSGATPSFEKITKKRNEPDFFITNMKTESYDSNGKLTETVNAQTATSFNKGKRNELDNPVMNIFEEQQLTWRISARKGFVTQQGEKIKLQKNVVVISQNQDNVISTSALTIYPKKNLAENNKPTTITTPQGVTTTVGIKADLQSQHTILKQKVKGEYHVTP